VRITLGVVRLFAFCGATAPPLPPAGTAPIAAGIDSDPHDPWLPSHELGLVGFLKFLVHLEKYLLGDLFGVVVIGQEQSAQAQHLAIVGGVESLV
jgi:hypothetical protein